MDDTNMHQCSAIPCRYACHVRSRRWVRSCDIQIRRDVKSLQNKFKEIRNRKVPTGDPYMPPYVARAKRLYNEIESMYGFIDTESDIHKPHSVDESKEPPSTAIASQMFNLRIDESVPPATSPSPSPSSSSSASSPHATADRKSPLYTAAHKRKRKMEDAVLAIAEGMKRQHSTTDPNNTIILELQKSQQQFQLQLLQQQQQFMMQQNNNKTCFYHHLLRN